MNCSLTIPVRIRYLVIGEDQKIEKEKIETAAKMPDMNQFPLPLKKEAEIQAIHLLDTEKAMEGRRILIEHNLRLVVYIARKFTVAENNLEDLISIGTIGLVKAVQSFDPQKNIKLVTYATRCIENEIRMYMRHIHKIPKEISIDEPVNVDGKKKDVFLLDVIGIQEDSVLKKIEDRLKKELLLKAFSNLNRRDQLIIGLRYGLISKDGHGRTQKEVADYLGISQSNISRLEKQIIAHLRMDMD